MEADPGQQQGQGVGEVMAGIGKQGQRVGLYAGGDFDGGEGGGGDQRPSENAAGSVAMIVAVSVLVQTAPPPVYRGASPLIAVQGPRRPIHRPRFSHRQFSSLGNVPKICSSPH